MHVANYRLANYVEIIDSADSGQSNLSEGDQLQ